MTDVIRFYRGIPDARHPVVADASAMGALPTKAFRKCEPVRLASAFGWYVFPVHDLTVQWGGRVPGDPNVYGETTMHWWFGGRERSLEPPDGILSGHLVDEIQYPDFPDLFDAMAPPRCQGAAYPWVSALQEPGLLQLWTGWMVRTPPEWGVLLGPVANRPHPEGYFLYEGIIDADTWGGPLFTNIRLTHSGVPVEISARYPLLQMRPLTRSSYTTRHLVEDRFLDATDPTTGWDAEAWTRYYETAVVPRQHRGAYAIASRQRTARAARV